MSLTTELNRRARFARSKGWTEIADLYQEAADRGATLKASKGLTAAEVLAEAARITATIKEADELWCRK